MTDAEIAQLVAQEAEAHPQTAPTESPSRTVRYRVRNWCDYNQVLIQRGSLTIWFDEQTLDAWLGNECIGLVGAPTTYAQIAIQCMLTLKALFRLGEKSGCSEP